MSIDTGRAISESIALAFYSGTQCQDHGRCERSGGPANTVRAVGNIAGQADDIALDIVAYARPLRPVVKLQMPIGQDTYFDFASCFAVISHAHYACAANAGNSVVGDIQRMPGSPAELLDYSACIYNRAGMKLIAHRGGAGLRVENTLAAFEHAIELGADGAELDVHLSADGQVIVHHDERLNSNYCRHIGGDWIAESERLPLAELSVAQMQAYELGAAKPGTVYARQFDRIAPLSGQHIPLLRDVIELAKSQSSHFFLLIEIKASLLNSTTQALQAVADATLAVIEQAGFAERSILCSFDWGTMRHSKAQWPVIPTWFITPPLSWFAPGTPPATDIPPDAAHLAMVREYYAGGNAPWFADFDPRRFDGSYAQAVAAAGGNAWYPFYGDCSLQTCQESARLGLDSAAWTVNLRDDEALRHVAQTGVGNLTVDYPDSRPRTAAQA